MPSRNYLDYLESPEWWTIRKQAMRRAGFKCEREKSGDQRHDGPLEVHHRHYQTLGFEGLDDVEVLCSACHRAERRPRNAQKILLERVGQSRLFDRWDDGDDHNGAAAA